MVVIGHKTTKICMLAPTYFDAIANRTTPRIKHPQVEIIVIGAY